MAEEFGLEVVKIRAVKKRKKLMLEQLDHYKLR